MQRALLGSLMQLIELAGKRFGRLLAIRKTAQSLRDKQYLWECACDCGESVTVLAASLRKGNTKSCGCYKTEKLREKGGIRQLYPKIYLAFSAMIARCHNPSVESYSRYGGRGIQVCDRWRHSFDNFIADMGPKPTESHTIERVDNDRGYEPGNCTWATRGEQASNRRSNRYVECRGERLTVTQWASRLGVSPGTLSYRVRNGWDDERAILTPFNLRSHA